jgi:hypothetical protein
VIREWREERATKKQQKKQQDAQPKEKYYEYEIIEPDPNAEE